MTLRAVGARPFTSSSGASGDGNGSRPRGRGKAQVDDCVGEAGADTPASVPARGNIDQHHAVMSRAARMQGFGLVPEAVAAPGAAPVPDIAAGLASGATEALPGAMDMDDGGRSLARALDLHPGGSFDDTIGGAERALEEARRSAVTLSGVASQAVYVGVPAPAGPHDGVTIDADVIGEDGVATPAVASFGGADEAVFDDTLDSAAAGGTVAGLPTPLPTVRVSRGRLEYAGHYVPRRLQSQFAALFGGLGSDSAKELKAVTVAQRTALDMGIWTSELAEERASKASSFAKRALDLVTRLRGAGHWADYVDPATGLPFLAEPAEGAAPLSEVDDRFEMLGFSVVDLGCCKALSHHDWGTNCFVGAVFTDAPAEALTATLVPKE